MIVPRYSVRPSLIPGAGKGLFLEQALPRGAVIIAPDRVHTLWPESRLREYAADSIEVQSSVRWFENWFSLTPEWSDECFVNHAAQPTGLWHLGFIFAAADLASGTEVTADYRFLLGSGESSGFRDSVTGEEIIGLPWHENLRRSAESLLQLLR